MTKLGPAEIKKIAQLARLQLTEAELTEYAEKIGRVLDHMAELNKVSGGEETGNVIPPDSVSTREDSALPFDNAEGILKNAPDLEGNLFVLPTIRGEEI